MPVRRIHDVSVEIDGRFYGAKFLGKGSFSRAYRVGDRVVLYTKGDCAKEVLDLYQYDKMMHLPDVIRHENTDGGWWCFSMPYYRNVSTKDQSAWKLYRALQAHFNVVYGRLYYRFKQGRVKPYGPDLMYAYVASVKADGFPNSVVNALMRLTELAMNCGDDVGFDFHKGNFGVNEYGVLIFRDVIAHYGSGG